VKNQGKEDVEKKTSDTVKKKQKTETETEKERI
jgi:hypothetical protein